MTEFAAAVAPEIDRVTIAVHPVAKPAAVVVLRAAGLSRGGLLVSLLTPLLAGPALAAELHSINRYMPYAEFRAGLDEHVRQGMLRRSGDVVAATDSGRAVLTGLRRAQGTAVTGMLAGHDVAVARLRPLVDRALAAADGGVAFGLMTPPEAAESSAHALHDRITALRYHRADAHAAAWAAAGLTAASVPTLEGPDRERIETETNRRAGQPYAALSDAERTTLLADLSGLRGW